MSEPVDIWPQELANIVPFETLTSPDGRKRVRFWRRDDGCFQFLVQHLLDCEDEGQKYSVWSPKYPTSGTYNDFGNAMRDAKRVLHLLPLNRFD